MKTKRIVKLVCLAIVALLVVTAITLTLTTVISYNGYFNKHVKHADVDKRVYPTIDFVQPWMIEWFTEQDYQEYFALLTNAGYNGIIFQYSTSGSINSPKLYFEPTSQLKQQMPQADSSSSHLLGMLLEQAQKANFDVYVGLGSPDEWWVTSNYANKDFMQQLADNECAVVQSIYDNYNSYDSFVGWYLAVETYGNPFGWQNHWVGAINQIIAKIDTLADNRPLMLSPFKHKFLPATTASIQRFWTDFLQQLNLRKGDIFAPQDSIGKINNGKVSSFDLGQTYSFLKGTKGAVDKLDGVKFWVNCELFASKNLLSGTLYTADIERIALQLDNASLFADTIVTFSFSHYCLPDGTHTTNSQIYQQYIQLKEQSHE
ncbi:MAG: DUF4434 domain-containing protein [Clostridia bacterium]|nr:DUF4434 domain-containing protein [Clostridia bacterium]